MRSPTSILGLNAWHGDAAACLVVDGELVAAAEEERFRRLKHWAGFPSEAIRWCLAEGGIEPEELTHVAVNRDPGANLWRKVAFSLRRRPDLSLLVDRVRNRSKLRGTRAHLAAGLGMDAAALRAEFHNVEHHRAHMASAFLVSPFDTAAVASVDGFGDFTSAMWGRGDGTSLETRGRVSFPHSLGLYYLALTQHLGFHHYGDEYKVMGLAALGEPRFLDELRDVVRLRPGGRFELGLDYFRHHTEGVEMSWEGGAPEIGRAFSPRLEDPLGPAREPGGELEQRHRDLAASIQAMYEEAFFHLLAHLHESTGETRLTLAGGCGMNSLANGRITERTPFREVYVQPAAGDSGGALGAAFAVWNQELGQPRSYVLRSAGLGPAFDRAAVDAALAARAQELERAGCRTALMDDADTLCAHVAERIAEGGVIGWFQGRMEWGPRALGHRSILGDPRRSDMKDLLNHKIKRRESFRPFAPSVLREEMSAWFELTGDVPFMSQVFPIRPECRERIPAVTHADGTGRLQTVDRDHSPLYHRLISAFHARTGVPMLLNTSFNENEPVVCRPEEALDCFLRTRMDMLVLGERVIERVPTPVPQAV
jgi:carbamoyltransferase